jgi:hypothetical protein
MNAYIGRIALRLRTGTSRPVAEQVAREFRGALSGAFSEALEPYASTNDVAIVPRLRVTLTAPLGRLGGRELARRIARACIDAIASQCGTLGSWPTDSREGSAERTLRVLRVADGVRVDRATETASWLVALVRDEPGVIRHASPYADLATRPLGAAFLEVCARSDVPRSIIAALGSKWARILALRCSPAEATALLRVLDDGTEPDAATWRVLLASLTGEKRWETNGLGRGLATPFDALTMEREYARDPGFAVRVLAAALGGLLEHRRGIVAAARSIVSSRSLQSELLTSNETLALPTESVAVSNDALAEAAVGTLTETEDEVAGATILASDFTGFWLLLPHLTCCLAQVDEPIARAVVFAVAERICGEAAASDPAISAFMDGQRADDLLAFLPGTERISRLTARVIRSFARSLAGFERARCGYVVRALLRGPAQVRRTPKGWMATLPRSPLRIVLEHAGLLGRVPVPWSKPVLEIVGEL